MLSRKGKLSEYKGKKSEGNEQAGEALKDRLWFQPAGNLGFWSALRVLSSKLLASGWFRKEKRKVWSTEGSA